MRLQLLSSIAAALPLALVGCTSRAAKPAFNVVVRGPASSCTIEVDGRKVANDELMAIARSEATSGRSAHIISNTAELPYRCIGGTIYALQVAGFKKVKFVAEPTSGPH